MQSKYGTSCIVVTTFAYLGIKSATSRHKP